MDFFNLATASLEWVRGLYSFGFSSLTGTYVTDNVEVDVFMT